MNPAAYSAILYSLAEGIHPFTGDSLPEGLIDQPKIIRALFAGARLLESGKADAGAGKPGSGKADDRPEPRAGRENAGKPWSKEDDALLMENYASGMSKSKLAKAFKRSEFAIEARLEKLENAPSEAQMRRVVQRTVQNFRPSGALANSGAQHDSAAE